jgi:hypothetical protein
LLALTSTVVDPAADYANNVVRDARYATAGIKEPSDVGWPAYFIPGVVRISRVRRPAIEAHGVGSTVVDKLEKVRCEPLLLTCIVEEDRERQVVPSVPYDWADAGRGGNRFAKHIPDPAGETALLHRLRIAYPNAITEAGGSHRRASCHSPESLDRLAPR